jgi:hypothetical protein
LHLAFDNLGRFLKVMSRYGPIGEIAAINTTEVENLDMVDNPLGMFWVIGGELSGASDGKGPALSAGGAEISIGASDDGNSRTYYFGPSTITRGKIKEMVEKGYFAEGEAREPGAETVPKPDDDKAIVYKDFFCHRSTHASASCIGQHSAILPGAVAPVDAQCDGTTLEIFMGCW